MSESNRIFNKHFKIDELNSIVSKAQKVVRRKIAEMIGPALVELGADYVTWVQGIPGYNDGEQCEFQVGVCQVGSIQADAYELSMLNRRNNLENREDSWSQRRLEEMPKESEIAETAERIRRNQKGKKTFTKRLAGYAFAMNIDPTDRSIAELVKEVALVEDQVLIDEDAGIPLFDKKNHPILQFAFGLDERVVFYRKQDGTFGCATCSDELGY